jgi:hypothetical protein
LPQVCPVTTTGADQPLGENAGSYQLADPEPGGAAGGLLQSFCR